MVLTYKNNLMHCLKLMYTSLIKYLCSAVFKTQIFRGGAGINSITNNNYSYKHFNTKTLQIVFLAFNSK